MRIEGKTWVISNWAWEYGRMKERVQYTFTAVIPQLGQDAAAGSLAGTQTLTAWCLHLKIIPVIHGIPFTVTTYHPTFVLTWACTNGVASKKAPFFSFFFSSGHHLTIPSENPDTTLLSWHSVLLAPHIRFRFVTAFQCVQHFKVLFSSVKSSSITCSSSKSFVIK